MLPIALDPNLATALVGSGPLAVRRLQTLDAAGFTAVTVYAPQADPDLVLAAAGRLAARLPTRDDLARTRLLFVADLPVSDAATLAEAGRRAGCLVNVEDRLPLCDFHMPAIVRRGDLVLAIATAGKSPRLAARLRAFLDTHLEADWSDRMTRLAALRDRLRAEGATAKQISIATDAIIDGEGWLTRVPPSGSG